MQEPTVSHASSSEPYVEHATSIPTAPAVASVTQPALQAAAVAAPAPIYGRVQRSTRLSRRLMRRSLHASMLVGRALRPFALTLTIAAVLLGVIGWMAAQLWMPSGDQPTFQQVASIPPAASVENFIKGQQNFDANMMWESLSEPVKAQLLSRGDSKETWQYRAELDKRSGMRYGNYDYVGGVKLDNGSSMFFYLVDVESPRPDRSGPTSYVFTIDEEGKILNIE